MADAAALKRRAQEIAEDVLLPAAIAVDQAERIPASHLDLLAADGFYGLAPDPDIDLESAASIVETLASGCLASTFVWSQHHSPIQVVAASDNPGLRDTWLDQLATGQRRAGIGLAGIRSDQNPLRVRATAAGFILDGEVPWVTGWDMIDTVHVAARDADDVIHYLLVDAVTSATLVPTLQHLVAIQASRTVTLTFHEHLVPPDRLTGTQPYQRWLATDSGGSVFNGFLALGVARRCCQMLGRTSLDAELDACRAGLLGADPAGVPAARAAVSELAYRAAGAVAVTTGARGVLRDNHAQRLVREAMFLLVFGSRPAIRAGLLERLRVPL